MSQTTATSASPTSPEPEVKHHPVKRAALLIAKVLSWLVLAYLVVVQIILFLGFLLKLLGADPSSSFVQWAYRNLDNAMKPFRGIFEPIEIGTTSGDVPATIETSIIFAMIVYGIIALAVSALVNWLTERIERMDAEEAQERAWLMKERELQAISDRAAIARAEQASAAAAAAAAAASAPAPPAAPSAPSAPAAPAEPCPAAPPTGGQVVPRPPPR